VSAKLIIASITILTASGIFLATNTSIAQVMVSRQYPFAGHLTHFRFGTIGSIQNGGNGKPQWILSGVWKTNLLNQSGNVVNSSNSLFDASFRMIMLNGSAMHTHLITDFVLENKSMPNAAVQVFNGTSTLSMKEGPITNIPTTIKIMNDKVISIWLDHQSKLRTILATHPYMVLSLNPDLAPVLSRLYLE
jgi:hypothetical protein